MCRLGLLYNYEEMLKVFIEKKIPSNFHHLKRLKDLKVLSLKEFNPEKNSIFPLICPITKIIYNGLNKFKAVWNCGCVFSEKILDEMKNNKEYKNLCPVCNKHYESNDLISLNMSTEDQLILKNRLISQEINRKKRVFILFLKKKIY